MLRSQEMDRVALYFGKENIRKNMERLGESGLLQMVKSSEDAKSESSVFLQEFKSLEKLEQRLSYLKNSIELRKTEIDDSRDFCSIKEEINRFYSRMVDLKHVLATYDSAVKESEEHYKVAAEASRFIQDVNDEKAAVIKFDFIPCIADRDKKFLIRKILKQKLRRNVFIKMIDVDLKTSERQKTIFIVYVLGETAALYVQEIIHAMDGRTFDCKTMFENINSPQDLKNEFHRLERLQRACAHQIEKSKRKIGEKYPTWLYHILKEKRLFQTMSLLIDKEENDYFLGEAWVPKKNMGALERLKSFDCSQGRFFFEPIKTEGLPPTYFDESPFYEAFQNLTNVFGIPKYGEINPALFLVFTFPFMFGAMFGDILHGLILLGFSIFMISRFDKLNHNCGIFQIILNGRYVMLLCSMSAIWFGFLYGDFGSLPVALFQSQYVTGRTYPFGIDPVWHHAENKMVFINALKMKLSLIIGFVHMSLGGLISILNAMYFKDRITLVCVAIPQFIAFTCFLGYLVFLCVYKWLVTSTYPSIVNTLIGMYTDPFHIKEHMYPGQLYVQLLIYAVILFCVPWMLLSKPMYLVLKKRVPKEGMLDLWITSGIHVVEFCLGLISNTSSYLRLWAVSLAHVQLTSVLHQFTIGNQSWVLAIICSPIYIFGTLLLLVGLEGLSACLHALRLNWIEFFSKFYAAGGEGYNAFSFKIKYEEVFDE